MIETMNGVTPCDQHGVGPSAVADHISDHDFADFHFDNVATYYPFIAPA